MVATLLTVPASSASAAPEGCSHDIAFWGRDGATPFGLSFPKIENYGLAAFELAVNALQIGPTCFQTDSAGQPPTGQYAMMFLARWVANEPRRIMLADEQAAWAWLDSQSQADVTRWINAYAEKIHSCTLNMTDFR